MPKKLTIEFIKSEFKKKGWVCSSKEYIGAPSKLDYICPEGHIGTMTWNSWQKNRGCLVCSGKKKHTIGFIKSEFEKEGWECTSTEYINVHSKLDYICSNGHTGTLTWANWSQGFRCPVCAGIKKLTIGFVKSEFEKEGWRLTSKEYINSYSKLDYICPKGHIGSMPWRTWNHSRRCPSCTMEKISLLYCGSGNPAWKGGISKEPYCQEWTKDLKEFVKQRDGHKCMNPCCNSKNPYDLAVHHIEYNKKLCGTKDLITVCRGCNNTANGNRKFHEAWYKAIMYRRYGYIYDNTN